MEDLVSIIVPVYNAERFLDDTINTVLNQTYTNWELILVNDCSNDNSLDIINKYVKKDKRINLINLKKNSGVSIARNTGVKNAKGDYIAFLDSDDMWDIHKLELQVELLNVNPSIDLIYTGSSYIDENNNSYDYILNVPDKITYRKLLKQNIISCSSVLVRRDLMLKYKMQNDGMHEDFAVWLTLLKAGFVFAGINKPLLLYRINRGSKSFNKLKAARMNYKVYKFMNLNIFDRLYNMFFYSINGIFKYKNIKK